MSERKSVDGLFHSYIAAVDTGDVDAFMALYDDGARIFDTWERWEYDGTGEWRTSVAEWFGSHPGERVRVSFDDVKTVTSDDVGGVSAIVTYAGLSADGEELRAMQNRLTWVLRCHDDRWTIVHEHTSAPAAVSTGKVVLKR